MSVVGRFRVGSVEDRGEIQCWNYATGGSDTMPQVAVKLQACTKETDSDKEQFDHESFYRSTPQGHIEMVIQNPDAAERFQTGDLFEVRLERIPSQ